jgi:hypothetical protein
VSAIPALIVNVLTDLPEASVTVTDAGTVVVRLGDTAFYITTTTR